jgi:hypothetical protein
VGNRVYFIKLYFENEIYHPQHLQGGFLTDMSVRKAYDTWSSSYDTDENKTRDLEAIALRTMLEAIPFENCLEIGCGTGKNTIC